MDYELMTIVASLKSRIETLQREVRDCYTVGQNAVANFNAIRAVVEGDASGQLQEGWAAAMAGQDPAEAITEADIATLFATWGAFAAAVETVNAKRPIFWPKVEEVIDDSMPTVTA